MKDKVKNWKITEKCAKVQNDENEMNMWNFKKKDKQKLTNDKKLENIK